jgi:hypothetical protein
LPAGADGNTGERNHTVLYELLGGGLETQRKAMDRKGGGDDVGVDASDGSGEVWETGSGNDESGGIP